MQKKKTKAADTGKKSKAPANAAVKKEFQEQAEEVKQTESKPKAKTSAKAEKTSKAAKTAAPKNSNSSKTVKKAQPAKKTPKIQKTGSSVQEEKNFQKEEIFEIVENLEEMRADILESIEAHQNLDLESGSGGDEADIASRNLNNEMLYELSSSDRIRVRDIEAALTKIKKGTYGICEHCKKPIEKKRLKFMPYVRYCVSCQNGSEASRRKLAE